MRHLERVKKRATPDGITRMLSEQTVTDARIKIAKDFGLEPFSVDCSAEVCRLPEVNLPFWASCTLSEMESADPSAGVTGGANIYGHDVGGVFSDPDGRSIAVTSRNNYQFTVRVMNGEGSNGVGPRQVTYAGSLVRCTGGDGRNGGYFRVMAELGLLPWRVYDNIYFGDMVFADHRDSHGGSYYTAARLYNGKESYAREWVRRANLWRGRLGIQGGPIS